MNNRVLYPLMNILFPEEDFLTVPELFYRKDSCLQDSGQGFQQESRRYSFDTWMNLFAVKKWRFYCDLGNIFLRLCARGRLRIELVGHNLDAGFGLVSTPIEVFEYDFGSQASAGEFPLNIPENVEGVSLHVSMRPGSCLKEGAWCTDRAPLRQSHLALVSCVSPSGSPALMEKFHAFAEAHPALQERMHLFLAGKGRALAESSSPYITILPQVKAGEAGALARGLMEANDGAYSRCLFWAGEAEVLPESFYRTLKAADYLKEEYKDAFISGVALDLSRKTICLERPAATRGLGAENRQGKASVVTPKDVLRCIHVSPSVFEQELVSSSWQYSCFSLENMKDEYPIPALTGAAEKEWSWRRCGTHHVVLNGICVWQESREWQADRLQQRYYLPRNMFLAHAVHDKKFQETFEEDFTQVFEHLLNTLDYASVDLYLAAMTDILKGREAFAENPLRQRARLARLCPKPETHASHDKGKLLELGRRSLRGIQGRKGLALDFNTDPGCYQGKQEVKVYNLLQESYERRVRDEGKEQRARREFAGLLYLMGRKYEALAEHMKKCQEEFKTRAFWDDYLGKR